MKLEADARISFPRELVYSTYRDRLPQMIPFLPNIKSISVESREDDPDGKTGFTKMHNLWRAKGDIPRVAQRFIKPEALAWDDYAEWNQNEWTTDWRIETKMFTENVKCYGHNTYTAQGDDAVLFKIRGELEVNLKGVPGVPRLLAGTVAPAVEKFIIALLTPNLTSVAKGLEDFLKSEQNAKD